MRQPFLVKQPSHLVMGAPPSKDGGPQDSMAVVWVTQLTPGWGGAMGATAAVRPDRGDPTSPVPTWPRRHHSALMCQPSTAIACRPCRQHRRAALSRFAPRGSASDAVCKQSRDAQVRGPGGSPGAHLVGGADSEAVGAPALHAHTSNEPAPQATPRVRGRRLLTPTAEPQNFSRRGPPLGACTAQKLARSCTSL